MSEDAKAADLLEALEHVLTTKYDVEPIVLKLLEQWGLMRFQEGMQAASELYVGTPE